MIPATRDPRRSFMVNGAAYMRELHRKPEPAIGFVQALLSGLAVAAIAVSIVVFCAG